MANYNVGNIEIGAVVNDKASQTLDNIIAKIDKVNNTTVKLKKGTDVVKNSVDGIKPAIDKISKSLDIGKIYVVFNYLRKGINTVTKLIQYASDYVETLNKFEVSFGKLYEENLNWVEKLAKSYGFSKRTLMEYTSTFNNMLSSLKGLSRETSATISRTLTQMAIDYSSLFNQSIESTMLAFQSMLSGSIRPIRSASGFDVSETSIFQVYQELGGTKTMRQLTQLEKRLLRIIAVQRQMQSTGAVGDYAKTIETFSNQIRILKEQIIELGSTWGKIALVKLKPVVVYINAILITLNALGEELSKTIDLTSDFKIDEEFASMSTSVDDVTTSVEELETKLTQLGLDQLNVLGSSNAGNQLGIDDKIINAVQEYKSNLDKISYRAQDISRKILQWLGYTYNENGELQKTGNRLNQIIDAVKLGLTSILGYNISNKVITIVYSISKIKDKITPIMAKISVLSVIIGIIIAGFTNLYNTNNEFKNTIDETINNISNGLATIWSFLTDTLYPTIKPIIDFIVDAVSKISGDFILSILKSLEAIIKLLTGDFKGALEIIRNGWQMVGDYISHIFGFDNWNSMIQRIKLLFTDLRIFIYEKFVKPVGNFGIGIINNILSGAEKCINYLIKFINDFTKSVSKVWTWAGIPGISPLGTVSFKKIPYFAKGNVATEPTVGMFGEYAGAKNNPEITTPQSIMRETFIEALIPLVNAILKGDNEVVKAIKKQSFSIDINGRKFAESTYDDFEDVGIRKGKILFSK